MKLLKVLAAGAALAASTVLLPSTANALSYTECTWFNSQWDVCTTYTWNWETQTWEADTYFVLREEYDSIDP